MLLPLAERGVTLVTAGGDLQLLSTEWGRALATHKMLTCSCSPCTPWGTAISRDAMSSTALHPDCTAAGVPAAQASCRLLRIRPTSARAALVTL